jgi:hypothetical protein
MPARLAIVLLLLLLLPHTALARCPQRGWPSLAVCRPIDAWFVPGVIVHELRPAEGTRWRGAGIQIGIFQWSRSSDAFGASHGRVVFDIAMLGADSPAAGRAVLWRVGGLLSFEKNPGRALAIPYFGALLGSLSRASGGTSFVEATLGLHLWHTRNVIVSLDAGYLFPFDRVDDLAGMRAGASASVTLW